MSYDRSQPPRPRNGLNQNLWLTVLLVAAVFVVAWFQNRQPRENAPAVTENTSQETSSEVHWSPDSERSQPDGNHPDEEEPTLAEVTPDHKPASDPVGHSDPLPDRTHRAHHSKHASNSSKSEQANSGKNGDTFKVENQTIRDLEGKVVFKGTIDLKPTLDRIERGEANRHRNDGTSFQNREGRLPRKPSGYYKEYVHPTPGASGPGPQRIIIGKEGEVWYTPDHYKSFREIKTAKAG